MSSEEYQGNQNVILIQRKKERKNAFLYNTSSRESNKYDRFPVMDTHNARAHGKWHHTQFWRTICFNSFSL